MKTKQTQKLQIRPKTEKIKPGFIKKQLDNSSKFNKNGK